MRFPGLSKDRDDEKSKRPAEPMLNSEVSCVHCANGKTAKLLLITGQWNFYYCYRCRRWSQSHYSSSGVTLAVENDRIENSLTWFWRTEMELMRENLRAMKWIQRVFFGKGDEEKSKLV